jgi:O-antigen/teichoic acid export membrane protein
LSRTRRIAGNLFYLFSGEVISSALAFVITVWLARKLSDEGFGYWAFVQSVVVYLTLVVDLGLSTYGAREIARFPDRAREFIVNLVTIRGLLAIILFVIFSGGVFLSNLTTEMKLLYVGGALLVFDQAFNPEFAFQGIERMSGVGFWRIGVHLFYLIPVLLLVHSRADLWLVPYSRAVATVFSLIFVWFMLRKLIGRSPQKLVNLRIWKDYVRVSVVMAASVVVIKLYYTFDTFMLGLMGRPEAVGWYSAAYKIVLLFTGLANLVQIAFGPSFSKERDDLPALDQTVGRFALFLGFLGCWFTGAMFFFSQDLLQLLYGSSYLAATDSLKWLSVSGLSVFLGTVFLAPLLFSGEHALYLYAVLAGAVINVIANLVLIPHFSLLGAAWSVNLSNLVILVVAWFFYRRRVRNTNSVRRLLSALVPFIACVICVMPLAKSPMLRGAMFICLYPAVIAALNRQEIFSTVKVIARIE